MNSHQLEAKIYATEEKPFMPGNERKSLMMGKYVNLNQLKAKSPADIAQTIPSYLKASRISSAPMGKALPCFFFT